jgi:hypothetical protein
MARSNAFPKPTEKGGKIDQGWSRTSEQRNQVMGSEKNTETVFTSNYTSIISLMMLVKQKNETLYETHYIYSLLDNGYDS